MMTLRERFEETKRNACIVWPTKGNPYATIYFEGKDLGVHVVAWYLATGYWPEGQINHHCDTPKCVNVTHLYDGTPGENMRDRSIRGRANAVMGERNPRAKLTDAQVAEMRAKYAAGGVTQTALAEEYGMTQTGVGMILRGRTRRVHPATPTDLM